MEDIGPASFRKAAGYKVWRKEVIVECVIEYTIRCEQTTQLTKPPFAILYLYYLFSTRTFSISFAFGLAFSP